MPTITDAFNRANETPLSGGGVWVTGASDSAMNLATNQVVPSSSGADCSAIYTGSAFANDQSSACALTTTSTAGAGEGPGLWVRHAGTGAQTGYRVCFNHAATNNIEVARFNAGVFTSLAVRTAAWTSGDTWTLSVSGAPGAVVLTIKLNGVQQGATISDASGSGVASGSPGLSYSSTGAGEVFDAWTGSDATAGGATVTAVPAAGIGDVPAPTISAGATVTAPPAAGIGDMPSPVVTASTPDATVVAPPAAGIGDMPSAQMATSVEITPGPMSAIGGSPAPVVSGGSGVVDATVVAPPAAGVGDIVSPVVTAPDAGVLPGPAQGIGDVPAPVITGNSSTPNSGALVHMGSSNGSQVFADLLYIPERN